MGRDPTPLVHHAGPCLDKKQLCQRCGLDLLDGVKVELLEYIDAVTLRPLPMCYREDSLVVVDGDCAYSGDHFPTDGMPLCRLVN